MSSNDKKHQSSSKVSKLEEDQTKGGMNLQPIRTNEDSNPNQPIQRFTNETIQCHTNETINQEISQSNITQFQQQLAMYQTPTGQGQQAHPNSNQERGFGSCTNAPMNANLFCVNCQSVRYNLTVQIDKLKRENELLQKALANKEVQLMKERNENEYQHLERRKNELNFFLNKLLNLVQVFGITANQCIMNDTTSSLNELHDRFAQVQTQAFPPVQNNGSKSAK